MLSTYDVSCKSDQSMIHPVGGPDNRSSLRMPLITWQTVTGGIVECGKRFSHRGIVGGSDRYRRRP